MEDLKSILDPYKEGVRRAVLTETGLVRDKKHDPDKEECAVLSEVCRIVFDSESRDSLTLLERAYNDNIPAAWDALFDDVRLGLVIPRVDLFIRPIMVSMQHASSAKILYVSGMLAVAYAKSTGALKLDGPFDVHNTVAALRALSTDALYPALVDTYQQVMAYTVPAIEDVATCITEHPASCALFIKHPHLDHLCTLFPELVTVLVDAASSVSVTQRQPYMVMLALMARQGHRVTSNIALDTLTKLRSSKFHLNLAASAAIVACSQKDQDPVVMSLCMLVETLCTVIQKSCDIDTLEV